MSLHSVKAFLAEHAPDIPVIAAGATNSAVRIRPERLAALTGAEWVDVTKRADNTA